MMLKIDIILMLEVNLNGYKLVSLKELSVSHYLKSKRDVKNSKIRKILLLIAWEELGLELPLVC